MLNQIFQSDYVLKVSQNLRRKHRNKHVLFHGTRYPTLVKRTNCLIHRGPAETVSFTRSPQVAAYWATLARGHEDEGHGAIIVLDRQLLNARYRLYCHDDLDCKGDELSDEMEEFIYDRDVANLDRYILDWIPTESL